MTDDDFIDLHVPALVQFPDCSFSMQNMGGGICDIVVDGPPAALRQVASLFEHPVPALCNGNEVLLRAEIFTDGVPVRRIALRVATQAST